MKQARKSSIVSLASFIQATRDSGYKGISAALAELIDNALEAHAKTIDVSFHLPDQAGKRGLVIAISDDGCGMSPDVLQIALQFGGSTRFNSRLSAGRYGMGLPNSSLSHARRVEVYSWTSAGEVWWTYLDVDEVAEGTIAEIPQPKRTRLLPRHRVSNRDHGTVVLWTKCDRIDQNRVAVLVERLRDDLGRLFREHLWRGKRLTVNGELLQPTDPLFLRPSNNLRGAVQFGPSLKYEIEVPGAAAHRTSKVTVRFVELPIAKWHALSNEEKRRHGISKRAGVSILRAGREIDYGWFFMGGKRKENYDDWWRCEILFEPELDELFGVTHTKQGINATEKLKAILAPDMERAAHELNGRARKRYLQVRSGTKLATSARVAEDRDPLLEPPRSTTGRMTTGATLKPVPRAVQGLRYRIDHKPLRKCGFYSTRIVGGVIRVTLNAEHPFYERVYAPLEGCRDGNGKAFRRAVELLLFAAARAESHFARGKNQKAVQNYRELWSNALATFLA